MATQPLRPSVGYVQGCTEGGPGPPQHTGGLTTAGQVSLQAAAVQDLFVGVPSTGGWMTGWIPSNQMWTRVAGDSGELSEPESTLCEDNPHAGHSSLPVIDETPISMDRVVILDDGDLISNNDNDGNRISNDNDDRKDQDNDQNNGQDEECVAPSIWMRVDMSLENDVLVISDSLLKTIDENFIQWRRVEVYPFCGLGNFWISCADNTSRECVLTP